MTREAKIGMLTGLGVIVLIGVLLSEYLGDSAGARGVGAVAAGGAGGAGGTATGRMAELPVGEGYRHNVMEPVSVPVMIRDTIGDARLAGTGGELSSPIVTGLGMLPPAAFAVDSPRNVQTGPTVGMPVSPVAIGPAPVEVPVGLGTPPVIVMQDNSQQATAGGAGATVPVGVQTPAAGGATYTVAAGDTLAKIARKFYDSAKNSDVQRIVAANPGVLKDASTTLVQGKKLTIPAVRKAASPVATAKPKTLPPEVLQLTEPVVVHMPGDLVTGKSTTVAAVREAGTGAAGKADASKESPKKAAAVYVVQDGDTLSKIARKIAPEKSTEMVHKLMAANGIKDPTALQVGMKLKVPA